MPLLFTKYVCVHISNRSRDQQNCNRCRDNFPQRDRLSLSTGQGESSYTHSLNEIAQEWDTFGIESQPSFWDVSAILHPLCKHESFNDMPNSKRSTGVYLYPSQVEELPAEFWSWLRLEKLPLVVAQLSPVPFLMFGSTHAMGSSITPCASLPLLYCHRAFTRFPAFQLEP